ncbi:hypothetical protein BGZ54_001157 [Gamsiella multidivaricata]|nr:hypothetical protein BGZ54_001157 [Gamsiella multidivaricata]
MSDRALTSTTRPAATTNALLATLTRLLSQLLTRSNTSKLLGAYFLFILFKYRRSVYGVRPRPELKGPPGLPLIGNFWSVVSKPRNTVLQRQTKNHQIYGKVYAVTIPGVGRIININDPEMLDHILRVNFWAYEKGPRFKQSLEPLVGEASHIFSVKAFRQYTSDVFCREGQLAIDYLNKAADSGEALDLQQLFYCYTLDSFGEIAFGQSFGCLKDPSKEVEFAAAFDRLNHNISGRMISPIWRLKDWWTGNDKQILKDREVVRNFAFRLIQDRRREQQQAKGATHTPDANGRKDLLQLFMDLSDDGEALSDDMLVDSVLNFVIAGRDTTAQALSWTFYLMHRTEVQKDIVEKLVKETDDILQGQDPTYESTKKQKYAEACFYEALRLYPSVPKNIKTCVEDDELPGGIKVYKGERVGWSPWAMGRETTIWGPDAKEYKPERWLGGEKFSSAKFNAFHLGPRTCLGQQFATIEAITIMSMLAQKFTFELVDPSVEPTYIPSLTLPLEKGLLVRVKRRVNGAVSA